jgi:hypothetical protein
MKGQIKLKGNLMQAQKLQLLQPPKSKQETWRDYKRMRMCMERRLRATEGAHN